MTVEIFFVSRTGSDSVTRTRFCDTLPQSPTLVESTESLYLSRESLKKIIFFPPVRHGQWKHGRCVVYSRGRWHSIFESVNCLVRWIVRRIGKVGRDMVKTLNINWSRFLRTVSVILIIIHFTSEMKWNEMKCRVSAYKWIETKWNVYSFFNSGCERECNSVMKFHWISMKKKVPL